VVEWADVSVRSKAGVSNTLPPVLAAAGVYDGQPSYTVSIMEFRDGKVVRETQYFGDPFEPALREFNGLSGFIAEPCSDASANRITASHEDQVNGHDHFSRAIAIRIRNSEHANSVCAR
jgi:hypothetical protein